MGRLPIPGEVKTRLAAKLGPERAAELYRAFLLDVLELVEGARTSLEAAVVFSVALEGAHELDAARLLVPSPAWRVVAQAGASLGDRIESARSQAAADHVIVLGSDSPAMPAERLRLAFDALSGPNIDAVLGPTRDGGYDLIAFGRPCPALLADIPWSSSEVMSATRRAAEAAGLKLASLSLGQDVDELEDLEAMMAALADAPTTIAPRSREAASRVLGRPAQKPPGGRGGSVGSR